MTTESKNEVKELTQTQKFIEVLRKFISDLAGIVKEIPNPPVKDNIILSFVNKCTDNKAQDYMEAFIENSYSQWEKILSRDIESFKANWLSFFPSIPDDFKKLIKESASIVDDISKINKMDKLWSHIDLMIRIVLIEIIQKKKMTLKGVSQDDQKYKDIKDAYIVEMSRKFKLRAAIAQFEQSEQEK